LSRGPSFWGLGFPLPRNSFSRERPEAALTHERSFFLSAAVLRASFFSFHFSGLVQQGMSTSFRVRDFFSFRVFFEVSEHVSTASGDVDCSVRGIFHILIFSDFESFFLRGNRFANDGLFHIFFRISATV